MDLAGSSSRLVFLPPIQILSDIRDMAAATARHPRGARTAALRFWWKRDAAVSMPIEQVAASTADVAGSIGIELPLSSTQVVDALTTSIYHDRVPHTLAPPPAASQAPLPRPCCRLPSRRPILYCLLCSGYTAAASLFPLLSPASLTTSIYHHRVPHTLTPRPAASQVSLLPVPCELSPYHIQFDYIPPHLKSSFNGAQPSHRVAHAWILSRAFTSKIQLTSMLCALLPD